MPKILFVEYPKCSTCRKAKAWLDAHGVTYSDRDIVSDNPNAAELRAWWKASGLPLRRFFNTSGRLYRERGIKGRLDAGLSDDEALELLAGDGMMVKRPIVVRYDDDANSVGIDMTSRAYDGIEIIGVFVGFRESEWEKILA